MMKEFIVRHRFLLLIIVLSVIPLYSLFNSTLLYTQDGYTHLIRGAAYFKALKDFNIPPRWAGDLNYGYGMPLFIFVFQLPYQLYALFISLGFDLTTIFKILLFGSYFFSGISMYFFAKEFFRDEKIALFSAVLYQFFPYRFTDLLLRGSIGECLTFVFLPVVLLGITKSSKKITLLSVLLVSLGTLFLILSHLATGGVFILVSLLFSAFFVKDFKRKIGVLLSIIFGVFASSYYLISAVIEHKFTYGDLFAANLYKENLVPLQKLFSLSIFNEKTLRIGDVPVNLGVVYFALLICLLLSLFLLKRFKKSEKGIIIFSTLLVLVSLFMTLDSSKFIWSNITLMRQFQFPWRFLAPAGFALSLFGAFVVGRLEARKIYWVILLFIVLFSIPFWRPQLGYRKMDESYMWNYPMTTTYFGETDVIWSAGPAKSFPKKRVEVVSGDALITNVIKKNAKIEFNINSSDESKVVSHTQYFPGWVVWIDSMKTPIQFQDPNHRGEIEFTVPSGSHHVLLEFAEDKTRLLADVVTILSLLLFTPFYFFIRKFL